MEPDYTFVDEHHRVLEDATADLQDAGFDAEAYELRTVTGNDILQSPDQVAHEYEETLTRAVLSRLRDDTNPEEMGPEEMVYGLYRQTTGTDEPVLADITFKGGAGGEFIPYNGRSSGYTPTVHYRISEDDTPYFDVSAGDLRIQYDSTKEYLAGLGHTLHEATDMAVELPETVADYMDVDLRRADDRYTAEPVQGPEPASTAADDD